jgi:hypothetical protein
MSEIVLPSPMGFANVLSDQASRVVSQDELDEKRRLERMSGPGKLGLPPLLDDRRLEYFIVDAMFDSACVYDRVHIYQIPPKHIVERQREARRNRSKIAMSVGWQAYEQDRAHRGIIIGSGPSGLDYMAAHGMALGHIVNFALFSPLRHYPSDLEEESIVLIHAGQITSSEDTQRMLRSGQIKILREETPDGFRHIYQHEDGSRWKPELPWMPPEY